MQRSPEHAWTPALRELVRRNLEAFEPIGADAPGLRRAAVAVAIVGADDGRAGFVLTERSASLRHHAGQYALPGGRLEDGETPEQAALRELEEEVGLALEPGSVLGRLDDFVTRSGFVMTPVVAWGGEAGSLAGDPGEVAAVHVHPLEVLEAPGVPRTFRIPESDRPVIEIPLGPGDAVWAPAAAILYQLREVGLHGRPTRVAHFEQPVFAWR